MANTIRLEIVTPERLVYSQDEYFVIARTTYGDIGVLPGHALLLANLAVAPLRILTDDVERQVSVCGGFIEVQPSKITILADAAECAEEIDVKRAEEARKRAENRLNSGASDNDIARAQAALKRAMVRLQVASFVAKK